MYNSQASKLTNSLDVFRQIWACTDDSKGGNNLLEYLNHIEGDEWLGLHSDTSSLGLGRSPGCDTNWEEHRPGMID